MNSCTYSFFTYTHFFKRYIGIFLAQRIILDFPPQFARHWTNERQRTSPEHDEEPKKEPPEFKKSLKEHLLNLKTSSIHNLTFIWIFFFHLAHGTSIIWLYNNDDSFFYYFVHCHKFLLTSSWQGMVLKNAQNVLRGQKDQKNWRWMASKVPGKKYPIGSQNHHLPSLILHSNLTLIQF